MEDITDVLEAATNEMGMGNFIMYQGFTLFDSISALETMEPKMDCGLMLPEIRESLLQFRSWLQAPKCPDLLSEPESVLVLLDTLLGCETMWLQGFSWLQTHLTCYYVEAVATLSQPGCLFDQTGYSSNKCLGESELAVNLIKAFVYSLLVAGIHFRNVSMRYSVVSEEDFQTYDYGIALPPSVTPASVMSLLIDLEQSLISLAKNTGSSLDPNIILNILARIKFRKEFLLFLASVDCEVSARKIETLRLGTLSCLSQIQVFEDFKANCSKSLRDLCFDPNIVKKKSSNFPPRTAVYWTFDQMQSSYRSLFQSILEVTDEYLRSDFFGFLDFYLSLPSQRLCVLARTRPSSSRDDAKETFVELAAEVVNEMFLLKCLNSGRSLRKQRKLAHSLYDLSIDAGALNDANAVAWTKRLFFTFLRDFLEQHMLSGLVSTFELPFVFWFYEWFCSELVYCGNLPSKVENDGVDDNFVKDSNNNDPNAKFFKSPIDYLKHNFSKYYLTVLVAMRNQGVIAGPLNDNRTREKIRFENRFKPINCVLHVKYESILESFQTVVDQHCDGFGWKENAQEILSDIQIYCGSFMKKAVANCEEAIVDHCNTKNLVLSYMDLCDSNKSWLEMQSSKFNVGSVKIDMNSKSMPFPIFSSKNIPIK